MNQNQNIKQYQFILIFHENERFHEILQKKMFEVKF